MSVRYFVALAGLIFFTACADPEFNSAAGGRSAQGPEGAVQKPIGNYEVQVQFLRPPATQGDSPFFLIFSDNNSNFADTISVEIKSLRLWMPSMGHGSAPVKVQNFGGGIFQVTNVYFIMPGDWQIQLRYQIINSNGEFSSDEQSLNFDLFIN